MIIIYQKIRNFGRIHDHGQVWSAQKFPSIEMSEYRATEL